MRILSPYKQHKKDTKTYIFYVRKDRYFSTEEKKEIIDAYEALRVDPPFSSGYLHRS